MVMVFGCTVTNCVTVLPAGSAEEEEKDVVVGWEELVEELPVKLELDFEWLPGKTMLGMPSPACLVEVDVREEVDEVVRDLDPNGLKGVAAARGRATVRRVMRCILRFTKKERT